MKIGTTGQVSKAYGGRREMKTSVNSLGRERAVHGDGNKCRMPMVEGGLKVTHVSSDLCGMTVCE